MRKVNKIKAQDVMRFPSWKYSDDLGLYLNVKGNARSWVLRYKIDGQTKYIGLGSAYTVPLALARKKAQEYRLKLSTGDFIPSPKQEALTKARERSVTFAEVAIECIKNQQNVRKWRTESQALRWKRTLSKYAFPAIGDKALPEISRDEILTILNPLWNKKIETASNLQRYLNAVFIFAQAKDLFHGPNPAAWVGNLDQFLPTPSKVSHVVHHAALPWQQVPALFSNLYPRLSIVSKAIMFGVLTAARANEFCLAQWSEIDFKKGIWICPRRKDGRPEPHRVPLSPRILTWLQTFPKVNPYLFFGAQMHGHIALESPIKMLHQLQIDVTIHGMRSTFRDWAAEHGYDRILAEKALQHTTGNEVEQAYQRSDLLEQRRPMMKAWAAYCFSEVDRKSKKKSGR